MKNMVKQKRMELLLPEDHFIFSYPPGSRSQVLKKLLDVGAGIDKGSRDIGVKLDYIIRLLENNPLPASKTIKTEEAEPEINNQVINDDLQFDPLELLNSFNK